ncbi:dienelactone hydrolase family protein [Mesorhizobium sp. BR-1-1-10]|uniref:dienelactone hydrolase family protein n=1 Tax=Mesorhizobium sp. BR-1-1-10 TaxID=2876660 RepID=UPI001CD18F10|nr:dienelactone hydrolase family protein [Mesorhizobium sp. BR-1-1-10]MBZ9979368.1 dienelactone hydrolase family protein [Mesorhizobium sp. BR-1-1-10]
MRCWRVSRWEPAWWRNSGSRGRWQRGVLLLHGLATVPANTRPGLPIQLHVADTDPLFPEPDVSAWQESAEAARADVQVFRYPNAGHYFSDPALSDYNATAAAQLWSRSLAFLT